MFLSYILIEPLGLNGIGWSWLIWQTIFALAVIPNVIKECWPASKGNIA